MKMMRGKLLAIALVSATGLGMLGCDETPPPLPIPDRTPTTKPDEPTHPTTQALMSEPRITTSLSPFPLTIDLPASWKIHDPNAESRDEKKRRLDSPDEADDLGLRPIKRPPVTAGKSASSVAVEGPMPVGDGIIRITQPIPQGVPVKEISAETLLKRKPDVEKLGGTLTVRHLGRVTYLERCVPGKPMPEIDDPAFDWSVTIYASTGDHTAMFQVTLIGLTVSQYKENEQFLRPIIASIKYAG